MVEDPTLKVHLLVILSPRHHLLVFTQQIEMAQVSFRDLNVTFSHVNTEVINQETVDGQRKIKESIFRQKERSYGQSSFYLYIAKSQNKLSRNTNRWFPFR